MHDSHWSEFTNCQHDDTIKLWYGEYIRQYGGYSRNFTFWRMFFTQYLCSTLSQSSYQWWPLVFSLDSESVQNIWLPLLWVHSHENNFATPAQTRWNPREVTFNPPKIKMNWILERKPGRTLVWIGRNMRWPLWSAIILSTIVGSQTVYVTNWPKPSGVWFLLQASMLNGRVPTTFFQI